MKIQSPWNEINEATSCAVLLSLPSPLIHHQHSPRTQSHHTRCTPKQSQQRAVISSIQIPAILYRKIKIQNLQSLKKWRPVAGQKVIRRMNIFNKCSVIKKIPIVPQIHPPRIRTTKEWSVPLLSFCGCFFYQCPRCPRFQ